MPDSPSAPARPVPVGMDDPRRTVKCDFEIGRRMPGPPPQSAPSAAGPAGEPPSFVGRRARFHLASGSAFNATIVGRSPGVFHVRTDFGDELLLLDVNLGTARLIGDEESEARWARACEMFGRPSPPVEFKGPGPG